MRGFFFGLVLVVALVFTILSIRPGGIRRQLRSVNAGELDVAELDLGLAGTLKKHWRAAENRRACRFQLSKLNLSASLFRGFTGLLRLCRAGALFCRGLVRPH